MVVGAGVAGLGAALALCRDGPRGHAARARRHALCPPTPTWPSSGTAGAPPRCATATPSSPGCEPAPRLAIPTCSPPCSPPARPRSASTENCRRPIDRPVAHARRRGPRDAGLPAHHLRVGAAPRRCSPSPTCSIRDGVAVDGLRRRSQAPTACRSSTGVARARRDVPGRPRRRGRRPARRRSPTGSPAIGADPVPEEVEDTGIVYFSRFYELCPARSRRRDDGPIGGDLGYLKYAIFLGDNRTFSVTLATPDRRRRAAQRAARRSSAFDTTADAAARHEAVGRSGDLASRSPPCT